MKRAEFIKNGFLISGGILTAPAVIAKGFKDRPLTKLTVLHTNDTHSNIDPFPENHAKYPGLGGVSKRFELIENIRRQEEHVLLLDAGDIFQGTPYFNKYNGVLEMKVMSAMRYDAATMGNHDFDIGLDGFIKAKEYADFPFLCSNYDFSDTPLSGKTEEYKILRKGGVKIGIFGVGVELNGLVPDNKYGLTQYHDPIEVSNKTSKKLKDQGCDLIICLSHLGYSYENSKVSDLVLAERSENIDLIIGGHTHTFLNEPTQVMNKKNELVLVNQVGWAGLQVGRIDFFFERQLKHKNDVIVVN